MILLLLCVCRTWMNIAYITHGERDDEWLLGWLAGWMVGLAFCFVFFAILCEYTKFLLFGMCRRRLCWLRRWWQHWRWWCLNRTNGILVMENRKYLLRQCWYIFLCRIACQMTHYISFHILCATHCAVLLFSLRPVENMPAIWKFSFMKLVTRSAVAIAISRANAKLICNFRQDEFLGWYKMKCLLKKFVRRRLVCVMCLCVLHCLAMLN